MPPAVGLPGHYFFFCLRKSSCIFLTAASAFAIITTSSRQLDFFFFFLLLTSPSPVVTWATGRYEGPVCTGTTGVIAGGTKAYLQRTGSVPLAEPRFPRDKSLGWHSSLYQLT